MNENDLNNPYNDVNPFNSNQSPDIEENNIFNANPDDNAYEPFGYQGQNTETPAWEQTQYPNFTGSYPPPEQQNVTFNDLYPTNPGVTPNNPFDTPYQSQEQDHLQQEQHTQQVYTSPYPQQEAFNSPHIYTNPTPQEPYTQPQEPQQQQMYSSYMNTQEQTTPQANFPNDPFGYQQPTYPQQSKGRGRKPRRHKEPKFKKHKENILLRLIGWLFKLAIRVIVFTAIILLIIVGIFKYLEYAKEKELREAMESIPMGYKIEVTEEEIDWQADYDNDGLTNEQEKELGTDMYSLDTDNDGICDRTEVEMYDSDPTKWSTADDDVSDGTKIAMGKSVHAPNGFGEKLGMQLQGHTFTAEGYDHISIKTKDYDTVSRYVIKDAQGIPATGAVVQPFYAKNITGELIVKVDTTQEYQAYLYNQVNDTFMALPTTTTAEGAVIELKEPTEFPVFICNTMSDMVAESDAGSLSPNQREAEYSILVAELMGLPRVLFAPMLNVDWPTNAEVLMARKSYTSWKVTPAIPLSEMEQDYDVIDGYNIYVMDIPWYMYDTVSSIFDSLAILQTYVKTNGDALAYKEAMGELQEQRIEAGELSPEQAFRNELGGYVIANIERTGTLEEVVSIFGNDTDGEILEQSPVVDMIPSDNAFGKIYYVDTGFEASKDGFYTPNFGIKDLSEGGICAGFMHTTALIYNNEMGVPYVGEMSIDGEVTQETNYTITPEIQDHVIKGNVYDFTDLNFDRTNETPSLEQLYQQSPAAYDMAKVIGTHYAKHNYNDDMAKPVAKMGHGAFMEDYTPTGKTSDLVDLVDKLANRLAEDKIVPIAMRGSKRNGFGLVGHGVNAVGLRTSPYNPNMVEVLLYDNNFPNNEYVYLNENGEQERRDLSDRMVLQLWIEEERKNIMGNTSIVATEKYMYAYGQNYQQNPYDYDLEWVTYSNIDKNTFSIVPYKVEMWDEREVTRVTTDGNDE